MDLIKSQQNKDSKDSLVQAENSKPKRATTEIDTNPVTEASKAESPVSFSLVAGGRNLITLIVGGCIAIAVIMALSGDTCLLSVGCGHTTGGGPSVPSDIVSGFWSMAVALGFFAISGTLGLPALPAIAISVGLWALMKATLSL